MKTTKIISVQLNELPRFVEEHQKLLTALNLSVRIAKTHILVRGTLNNIADFFKWYSYILYDTTDDVDVAEMLIQHRFLVSETECVSSLLETNCVSDYYWNEGWVLLLDESPEEILTRIINKERNNV